MPEDVVALLVAANLGVVPDDLVMGRLPESPDTVASVVDTGGRPSMLTHNGSERRYPHVQVICRDRDPAAARDRARAIRDLLQATIGTGAAANGRTYQVILPLSEPFAMTQDSRGRALVGCNYECWLDAP